MKNIFDGGKARVYSIQKLTSAASSLGSTSEHKEIYIDLKLVTTLNIVLKCTGLSVRTSTTNLMITVLRYIYMSVMFALMLAGSILIFRLWIFDAHFDPDNIQLLVIHVSYIEGTFNFAFLIHWQRTNKFEIHRELLASANRLRGTITNKKQIKFLSTVLIIVSCIFIVFGVSSGIFLIEARTQLFTNFGKLRFTFFDERLHYIIHVNILYILFSITISFSFFSITCYIDKLELKCLNEHMEKEKHLNAVTLKMYIDKHSEFVKAVEQGDTIFRFYILKSFAFIVPLLVLIFYDVGTGGVALEVKCIYGAAVSYFATYTVVLNTLSSSVNWELWRTTEILFEKINSHDTEKYPDVYRIVTWFTHKSVHKPVGFTIGGLLIMSNRLLLKAVSFIATFLLFLIQTYPTQSQFKSESATNDSIIHLLNNGYQSNNLSHINAG